MVKCPSYKPRTFAGKKIGFKDGIRAIYLIWKYWSTICTSLADDFKEQIRLAAKILKIQKKRCSGRYGMRQAGKSGGN
jgi:hypothetical protein